MSSKANAAYRDSDFDDESTPALPRTIQPAKKSSLVNYGLAFGCIATPILLLVLIFQSYKAGGVFQLSSYRPPVGEAPQQTASYRNRFPDIRDTELQQFLLSPDPWDYNSYSPCGHTIESAREAGCKWSAMSFAWTPLECWDDEVEQGFLAVNNWTWYKTEDLIPGDEYDRDAVIRGDVPEANMDAYFHNVHCIFTLKKIQRSLLGLALSDNYMLRWDHAKHCEMYLMEDYKDMHSGGTIHAEIVAGKIRHLDCIVTG